MVSNLFNSEEFPEKWKPYRSQLISKYGTERIREIADHVFYDWLPIDLAVAISSTAIQLPHIKDLNVDARLVDLRVSRAVYYRLLQGPPDLNPELKNIFPMIIHLALSPEGPTFRQIVFKTLAKTMTRIDRETKSRNDESDEEIDFDETHCAILHFCFWHKGMKQIDLENISEFDEELLPIFGRAFKDLKEEFEGREIDASDIRTVFYYHYELYVLFGLMFEAMKAEVLGARTQTKR